jgi:YggT family protein
MFLFGNFLIAIAKILDIILTIYTWIIIAQAIISWVHPDPYNPIVRFLHTVTEPVLRPIRRRLPVGWGGFDFSPLLVLLAIIFLQEFLIKSLIQLGLRM